MKKYIVALETSNYKPWCWLATWSGNPGKTFVESSAKRYGSISSATFGLAHARKYKDFPDARIIAIEC